MDAVVFDLWNTLVPLPDPIKQQAFDETARVLGIDPALLRGPWAETRTRRETGDLFEYLRWLRGALGVDWSDERLVEAMRVRRQIHGAAFQTPDGGAVGVLRTLRAHGLRTAVVSNCTSDVSEMLSSSVLAPLLDAIVLSADVGIMKPDARIFAQAASLLGVTCDRCAYVGDGYDDELHGAAVAGMRPVLLDRGDGLQWNGTRVSTLLAVLEEVGVR